MSRLFTGFSTDKHKTVRVPEGFFEDLLPQITSMLEMKITLHLFWRLSRAGRDGGSPRMLSLADLLGDTHLRSTLAHSKGPRPADEAVLEGLELAVARGTILQLWVREEPNDISDGRAERWYLLNTRDNRAWVEALAKGEIDVMQTPLVGDISLGSYHSNGNGGSNGNGNGNGHGTNGTNPRSKIQNPKSFRVVAERPSVYALYEQNIGLLTPLLAEQLQDAESRYPIEWIEDAFKESVVNNKRNWRYIERILERWAAEGKDSGKNREGAGRGLDPDKYTKGKYAFLFQPDK